MPVGSGWVCAWVVVVNALGCHSDGWTGWCVFMSWGLVDWLVDEGKTTTVCILLHYSVWVYIVQSSLLTC